jgi:carbonic anhydrase
MNKKWGSTLSQWNRRNYGDRLLNEGLLGPWIRGRKKSAYDALETYLLCENKHRYIIEKIQRNIDRRIMMSRLDEILAFNEKFVNEKRYEPYKAGNIPRKKLVIVSWMDTRLIELLPKAMNLNNGDAKIVKNAGAMVSNPYGSVMKSVLVALYQLQAKEVIVVGHHGCGMTGLTAEKMIESMKERGIDEAAIASVKDAGVDIDNWLKGFESVEDNVRHSVNTIKTHPMLPPNTLVHGLVISPETGKLDVVIKDQ